MEIKILQVFYDKNGLPYKDKERTVHYPITSGAFLGASNTTQIRFYYDRLDELNESTFVAVSKLPNGRIGSEILESEYDNELQENYAVLNLSSFYTQYKGDVYISLQGYQGGVRVEQDEQGIYQIYGTPVIAATGSIKLAINYAPSFVGSGETENVTLQQVLGELSTKLGLRQETLHVEELPTVGNPNVWYVINDDEEDINKANIYIWNATTQSYVWVGDNTLDLGDYYTTEQGEQFENDINEDIATFKGQVESEIESVASGSPKGVYATLSDLESAYPTGTTGIYLISADGHWYYWNGSAWTDGGVYLSSVADNDFSTSSTNALQNKVLTYKANNLLPNIQGTSLRGLIVQLNSDNGVLLAEDNNHWYYWDGTQYKDGGLYQPIENNPNIKKVNEDLNKLLTKTNNILDGIKTANSSFHNENGYIFGSNYSAYLTTYPIPVKPNTTYKWYRNGVLHTQGFRLDALNIDKTFNSNIYNGQYVNTFTTPNNCYFIVLTSEIQYYYDETCIEDGQELVNEHLDIDIIEDNSITDDKLATKPLQLINNVVEDIFVDKTKVQSTNIDYTNGNAVSNVNFVACDFIEIEPETTYHVMRDDYKISQVGNMAFYNANKQYISGQGSNWSDWTTPANAKYVRFSVYMSPFTQDTFTFENVKIVKGTSAKAINGIKLFEKEMFSTLNGKKWVVIGDSITEVNYRADLHYHDYIKSKNNMSVVNMGVGGSGYINRQNQNACFYQRAANMPTDADVITVLGGVNDCLFATAQIGEVTDTGTTTWCGCVNTLIDTIRSLYTYAPLGIISPLPCDWIDPNNESSYDTQLPSDRTCRMSLFVEKLKEICELRGVPFLDLFHSSGMLPNEQNFKLKYFSCGDSRTGDGLHPNSEGQKLFTSKIENFIKGIIVYDS